MAIIEVEQQPVSGPRGPFVSILNVIDAVVFLLKRFEKDRLNGAHAAFAMLLSQTVIIETTLSRMMCFGFADNITRMFI
ncbi:MAG TPA: hypothetical protein VKU01_36950 [Bryobacteraceae bacterium]|nr:hypothetical protein [Bryobacteraceae bacterium]